MDENNIIPDQSIDCKLLPATALAFVGDAAYALYVRTRLLERGGVKSARLHQAAVRYVRAEAQARAVRAMLPELTEEEQALVRRGRNAKPGSLPKRASRMDYQWATGLEALIGYHALSGRREAAEAVAARAMEIIDEA